MLRWVENVPRLHASPKMCFQSLNGDLGMALLKRFLVDIPVDGAQFCMALVLHTTILFQRYNVYRVMQIFVHQP